MAATTASDIPRPPLSCRIPKRTQRSQHMVILRAKTYYSRRTESKITPGEKVPWVTSGGNQCKLPRVLSQERHTICAFRNKSWQLRWNAVCQGRPWVTQCPRFLLGAGHIGAVCPAWTKISDSQKERYFHRCLSMFHRCLTWNILFGQFRKSKALCLYREWWETFRNPTSQMQGKGQHGDLCKDSSLSPTMLTLFCTTPNNKASKYITKSDRTEGYMNKSANSSYSVQHSLGHMQKEY